MRERNFHVAAHQRRMHVQPNLRVRIEVVMQILKPVERGVVNCIVIEGRAGDDGQKKFIIIKFKNQPCFFPITSIFFKHSFIKS